MRRLLLLALALCGAAHAAAPPRIELSAAAAWKGWSRPGGATELDIRIGTDTATPASLDIVAGHRSVHAELELQPGRILRLQVPLDATERASVSVAAPSGTARRADLEFSRSESPLLGVGLAADEPVGLDGFHTIVLGADDLPRNASAYEDVDALILDAPTLRALDPKQLAALLAHAAACGRIAVVGADDRLRDALAGAGGCRGRALMNAASPAESVRLLAASLASSLPSPMPQGGLGLLAQPGHAVWNTVALALAAALAAAALAIVFSASLPALVLTPALAAALALALLHALNPASSLIVWSEGESGAGTALYQAWHQVPGLRRGSGRLTVPPTLAAAVRPCDATLPMRFEFDPGSGQFEAASFETRLFHQVALCHTGTFPMARALAIEAPSNGALSVTNTGARAWPEGLLLAGRRVHELPAVAAGAGATIGTAAGALPRDALTRAAMSRAPVDGAAALWDLELAGVTDAAIESRGWLLVSAVQR